MDLSTDFHCHLLPGMDDGSPSLEVTAAMLDLLSGQGIRKVYATPHYHHHVKPIRAFLEKRDDVLASVGELRSGVEIIPSAEVALEPRLSEVEDLPLLTMGDSPYILIELPFTARKEWIANEIDNLIYGRHLIPVFAHIERFVPDYPKELTAKIFAADGAVFQFTVSAFREFTSRRIFKNMVENGRHILLGSDAHGDKHRKPEFDILPPYLKKYFKKGEPPDFNLL